MKVRCINAGNLTPLLVNGKIYEGELVCDEGNKEMIWNIKGFEHWRFEDFRFEEVKELTFQEVIANIKKGEVWEDDIFEVDRTKSEAIRIKDKHSGFIFSFHKEDSLQLKRKKYSFAEAFKAYEEGKEIECCYGGQKLKKENKKDYYFNYDKEEYVPLSFDEVFFDIATIRSEWYIND